MTRENPTIPAARLPARQNTIRTETDRRQRVLGAECQDKLLGEAQIALRCRDSHTVLEGAQLVGDPRADHRKDGEGIGEGPFAPSAALLREDRIARSGRFQNLRRSMKQKTMQRSGYRARTSVIIFCYQLRTTVTRRHCSLKLFSMNFCAALAFWE
jgi:hypothetical protein